MHTRSPSTPRWTNPLSMTTLSRLFKLLSALIGLPSIATGVLYSVITVYRWHEGPLRETAFGDNPDAVLLMLKGIVQVIGGVASVVGALAQWVLNIAAIAAGVGIVFASLLWFTGRGLHAHATWARWSGFVMLTLALLMALLLALSAHGVGRGVMLVLGAGCGLGLHTLWVGAPHAALPRG